MTTTRTRTTRKGFTAQLLTAVLAVLAVVAASLTFTATAAVADSDGDHPNKITICHYVNGKGETKDGYDVISISIRAWENGHSFPDEDQQYNHDDRDVVYNGTSCPTIPTVTGYGEATATHGLLCWDDTTYGPFTTGVVSVTLPGLQMSQERANALATEDAELKAAAELARMLSDFPDHADGSCVPDGVVYTQTAGATGETDFCAADGVTTVTVQWSGTGTATSTVSDADALFVAQQKADQAAKDDLTAKTPAGATLGACGLVAVAPVQPATVAPVEPATVAVPAAATVPATVPAGEGSGIPATPAWLLVLLTLGTATVIATGTRLAMATNR
jgi:hypothetical protein